MNRGGGHPRKLARVSVPGKGAGDFPPAGLRDFPESGGLGRGPLGTLSRAKQNVWGEDRWLWAEWPPPGDLAPTP